MKGKGGNSPLSPFELVHQPIEHGLELLTRRFPFLIITIDLLPCPLPALPLAAQLGRCATPDSGSSLLPPRSAPSPTNTAHGSLAALLVRSARATRNASENLLGAVEIGLRDLLLVFFLLKLGG